MNGEIVIPDKEKIWCAAANLVTKTQCYLASMTRFHAQLYTRSSWRTFAEMRQAFNAMETGIEELEQLIGKIETTDNVVVMRPPRSES